MPTNKKEGLLFGLMMVFGMVLFMYTYNLVMEGLWKELSIAAIALQFLITLMVAFIVESFLIGPLAGGFVSKLRYDKSKKWKNILAMSGCMVTGMVLTMSVFGLAVKFMISGIDGSLLSDYVQLVGQNFIMALPVQLLIVGPIARWVLTAFIQNGAHPETVIS
ncbi:hypothetical protein [Planococcus lenghuensis]|uniref:DUF2798 domain-containing protein n=1 Tax=Planococcus lenghuensis TaxID=2213202 RepID=A0A1Q2L341_9BACL|nr:hypothetical protein [Planococcus lenghuensis]AQQ54885.1 hypothetical protein B0X71_18445 [Planococcus lenghuensis]